jgi:uncharacterized membrane protein YhhN
MLTSKQRLLVTFTLIACGLFIVARLMDAESLGALFKACASAGFLATALVSGAADSRYGWIILVGLIFSAAGDLLLLGRQQLFFLLGLSSFLIAHLAYITAFVGSGVNWRWASFAAVPVAILSFTVITWLTPHIAPHLLMPVQVYTLVISLMVVASFSARGAGRTILIPVGAVMFYASDLSVAIGQFLQPEFPNYVWGLPLYYGGQLLLALSITKVRQLLHPIMR